MRELRRNQRGVPECVIMDIDGVLCDNGPRQAEHLRSGNEDWDTWHDLCPEDPPNLGMVALANNLWRGGFTVVLVTNRAVKYEPMTQAWLALHMVSHDLLNMRSEHSYFDSKLVHLTALKQVYDITLAVDDDPFHVEMYERHGVPTLLIQSGLADVYKENPNHGPSVSSL